MIRGYVGTPFAMTVDFRPSRAGLNTVGYTVLDDLGNVAVSRTTSGVTEILVAGAATGIYMARIQFGNPFSGTVVWDTGQNPNGTPETRLRVATEELAVVYAPNVISPEQLSPILDLVGSLADENTMKIPDSDDPTRLRIIRKRPGDADWSNPISDQIVHIIRKPGQERYGGPPPS